MVSILALSVLDPWDRAPVWSNQRLIGSYIRSWERPGDLPRVIEIVCLFASGAQRNEREDTTISITSGRSPGFPNNACKYLFLP
jgi:hypothetical protein